MPILGTQRVSWQEKLGAKVARIRALGHEPSPALLNALEKNERPAVRPAADRKKRQTSRQRKYNGHLRSTYWLAMRRALFAERGKSCEWCHATAKLHVHHVTYERFGQERPEDLVILCRDCHMRVHAGQPALSKSAQATA